MSADEATPRGPRSAFPLQPQLPKLKPATMADVHPDDGPLVKQPTAAAQASQQPAAPVPAAWVHRLPPRNACRAAATLQVIIQGHPHIIYAYMK